MSGRESANELVQDGSFRRKSRSMATTSPATVSERPKATGSGSSAPDMGAVVFRREPARSSGLAGTPSASGVRAHGISSFDALRDLVEAKRVNLLILDNQIGGFFTGLEVVRKLRT